MIDLSKFEVWFLTGSQHLYGPETLEQVARHSKEVARYLDAAAQLPVRVVYKPVLTTADAIHAVMLEANAAPACVGVVAWMHTFSPAQMWIAGLQALAKPLLHLHTQFNRHLPWATIDMDFMNLNQSAHGDREFGYICTRLGIRRKVVSGFWQDPEVLEEIGVWTRAAAAWQDAATLRVARFGDNMRNVAVTEGDKVAARAKLRYSVHGYGIGDLVDSMSHISDAEVDAVAREYEQNYRVVDVLRAGGEKHESLREAARIEIGLRRFLESGKFHAFTDTFEDLHGMPQLPGLPVQRLMADGYGFAGEGDWKTAALVRSMKVMAAGLPGGTSFMEDYTYHFDGKGAVLGAHMLEVCPSIARDKPSCEIHPLSIGGKGDPVRLVFTTATGPAVNASVIDMGDRFRMIVNEVDVIEPEQDLPKLPVARALWIPRPNLRASATAWIYAGGAHHTGFSLALHREHLQDFATMAGIEYVAV